MGKALREYIDTCYLAGKRKNPSVRFQVYGTVITGGFLRKYSHTCCIYCDKDSVYYHSTFASPFAKITRNSFYNQSEISRAFS